MTKQEMFKYIQREIIQQGIINKDDNVKFTYADLEYDWEGVVDFVANFKVTLENKFKIQSEFYTAVSLSIDYEDDKLKIDTSFYDVRKKWHDLDDYISQDEFREVWIINKREDLLKIYENECRVIKEEERYE